VTRQPGVLPLRPLTLGELLDAAVSLLRSGGLRLLGWGLIAAVVEQTVLFPLRRWADLDLRYLPGDDRWSTWLLLLVVGAVTELVAITALAGPASASGTRALLGSAAPDTPRRRGAVTVVVLAVAGLIGLVSLTIFAWLPTYFLVAPVTAGLWLWCYGSFGLAVPAVVIDRAGPLRGLGRSVVLSSRGFLRALRVRTLAYLAWLLVRGAWGMGVLSVLELVYTSPNTTVDAVVLGLVYLSANVVGYPALACLDTVLHLESRMRSEGLDLALRRSLARGTDPSPVLARP
jgi:hypothetical protein